MRGITVISINIGIKWNISVSVKSQYENQYEVGSVSHSITVDESVSW